MDPYFQIKRESNSSLGWLYKSPRLYEYRKSTPMVPTEAMNFGSLLHCLVLEPENFDRDFFRLDETQRPEPDKTFGSKLNKAWKEMILEENADKILVDADMLKLAEAVARSVQIEASSFLRADGNVFEDTILWKKDGVEMKGKIDIRNPYFLADIKTTADSMPDKFQRKAFWEYQYHRQAAVYLDGDAGGIYTGEKQFFFIAVEKTAPYLVSIHEVSKAKIAEGMVQYRSLLADLKHYKEKNEWPHYRKEVYAWE